MAKYKIFETRGFSADLTHITKSTMPAIQKKFENYIYPELRNNPYFGPNIRRLQNWNPPTWRYRIGDWRFFYQISEKEKIIYMTAIYHRGEAYR